METLASSTSKQNTLSRLAKLQPSDQPRWGRMSAHQMLCHLCDSFRAVMGERYVSPAKGVMRAPIVKWVALYAPMHWPKGIATRPEMDQNAGGSAPVSFERDRQELVALMERFCASQRDFEWAPHPMFGKMSDRDWMRWGYLHTDHHLRQFGL